MPLTTLPSGASIVPTYISGAAQPISPTTSKLHPVFSFSTSTVIHHFHSATPSLCTTACASAWTSFTTWKRSAPSTRRNLLNRVAALFESHRAHLIRVQVAETSCTEAWAGMNVELTCNYLRETAACISSIKGEIPMNDKPDTQSFVFKEPIGPVLVIPPWNAALVLATRAVAGAIGAGCTVVLKASELSPATHFAIVEIFAEAGLPDGCLNSLQCGREDAGVITEALIGDERIRKVEFIGSAAVGRIIGGLAAKYLKPVLMELGGKCPSIVLDDADLAKAARLSAAGAVLHHGQICFSTERVIVVRKVAEEFQKLLAEAVGQHATGGTAVHKGIAEHAHEVLQDAKAQGSRFLVGDGEMEEGGKGMRPAIVLEPKGRIVDEETFGPSASLYVVEDDEEAVRVANRSAYGLNATIHSRDMGRAMKMARELEYGQVHVNSISVYTSPTGPQGGVKGSGWGRQNAGYGLREFVVDKLVTFHP